MPDRTHQRPNKANAEANALASWDNEGGAAKGAPQKDRDDLTFLDKKEERILRCLGAAVIVQWNDLPTDIQHELFEDRKSTRLNSSHSQISYAVFCLKIQKAT